uniref:Uncharacterized protein n=1 Tax=Picea glauca TaxID=3330 RepID=A0A101LYG5_PICGL|nr:hypothetical protein ABT39_MTgene5837 [Picea glauca]
MDVSRFNVPITYLCKDGNLASPSKLSALPHSLSFPSCLYAFCPALPEQSALTGSFSPIPGTEDTPSNMSWSRTERDHSDDPNTNRRCGMDLPSYSVLIFLWAS